VPSHGDRHPRLGDLGGVDPFGQRVEGVVGVDLDGGGAEHGSVIDALVGDEVDHHPGRGAFPVA
jgi:hypothetical protein